MLLDAGTCGCDRYAGPADVLQQRRAEYGAEIVAALGRQLEDALRSRLRPDGRHHPVRRREAGGRRVPGPRQGRHPRGRVPDRAVAPRSPAGPVPPRDHPVGIVQCNVRSIWCLPPGRCSACGLRSSAPSKRGWLSPPIAARDRSCGLRPRAEGAVRIAISGVLHAIALRSLRAHHRPSLALFGRHQPLFRRQSLGPLKCADRIVRGLCGP